MRKHSNGVLGKGVLEKRYMVLFFQKEHTFGEYRTQKTFGDPKDAKRNTHFAKQETASYTFYDMLYEKDNSIQSKRKLIIDGSKKYLSNLCSSMFKFLKQLSYHYQGRENFNTDAFEDLFPEVPINHKTIFLETLNKRRGAFTQHIQ